MIPLEGWIEKKKTQVYGKKSSGLLFNYKKKYFTLLEGPGILAYYSGKRVRSCYPRTCANGWLASSS